MGGSCVIRRHGGVPVTETVAATGSMRGCPEVVRAAAARPFDVRRQPFLAGLPSSMVPKVETGFRIRSLSESATQNGGAMSIIPLLEQSAFEPETIEMLVSVFEDAWRKVEESGSKLASPGYKRAAQEIIAKRIIDTAQGGESNPRQLADDAVDFLQKSYA
jgi:hypothetical protein